MRETWANVGEGYFDLISGKTGGFVLQETWPIEFMKKKKRDVGEGCFDIKTNRANGDDRIFSRLWPPWEF